MRSNRQVRTLLVAFCLCALNVRAAFPQEKAAPSTAEVHVVITDLAVQGDGELLRLWRDEVKVKQGKTFLQVAQLIPDVWVRAAK